MRNHRPFCIIVTAAAVIGICRGEYSSAVSWSPSPSTTKPYHRVKNSKKNKSASLTSGGESSSRGTPSDFSVPSYSEFDDIQQFQQDFADEDSLGSSMFDVDFNEDELDENENLDPSNYFSTNANPSDDVFDGFDLDYEAESQTSLHDQFDIDDDEASEHEDHGKGSEKNALYDAYNLLHTLAQDFQKPFDAPAVVVVGHQSSGKSALIEALMGFQFNQVGGGTKTRRPVSLRMQYNPRCAHPKCFLQGEDGVERPKSLTEIQEYIESENRRLERDPVRSFDPREINIRMEYKYCPNMILIDTPGLIAAPRVPRGREGAGAANVQQRALQQAAKEAERLVVSKMRCPDYIILCVEDTMDWKHGATKEVVQKADPDLSRTVIVNTKLDTKIPQFGTPSDVHDFLRADIIDKISPHKLGGPFFTSVPSGRVGRDDGTTEFLFDNDDDFVSACGENEDSDRATAWHRLKKANGINGGRGSNRDIAMGTAKALLPRVGISRLRGFLERRVDETYRRNVAKIVPLLQAEQAAAERRLEACERELDALSVERLKAGADAFCDEFCAALRESIHGSIVAPPSLFGETMQQENLAAGSFHDIQGSPMAVSSRTWDRLVATEVGNRDHRLYGGSQYHRALREFHLATRCMRLPTITEDEIANAAGVGDTHDGVNFLRASCVIAIEKARTSFDPLLESLRLRVTYVMGKLCSISEYMLRQRRERTTAAYGYLKDEDGRNHNTNNIGERDSAVDITQNPQFRQLVRTIFEQFVQKCSDSTMLRCRDDLQSLTRFVTWDLNERSSGALRRSLPDQTDIVSVYQVAVQASKKGALKNDGSSGKGKHDIAAGGAVTTTSSSTLTPMDDDDQNAERDYYNLLQLMEEAASSRDANRTNLVVGGLVQHIVVQWRETFGRSVTTKFNCYFMLPFVDEFHRYLRQELQKVYEGEGENLSDIFDLTSARNALQLRRTELLNEVSANKKLQEKFDMVQRMMRRQQDETESTSTSKHFNSKENRKGRSMSR